MFTSVYNRLRGVGTRIAADLARAHLRTQALRVIRLAVLAFAAQIAASGLHNVGWKALAAVGVSAVEAAVRQAWPALPLGAVLNALNGLKEHTPAPPAASPVTGSVSLSGPLVPGGVSGTVHVPVTVDNDTIANAIATSMNNIAKTKPLVLPTQPAITPPAPAAKPKSDPPAAK